jgi:hypothetical protein
MDILKQLEPKYTTLIQASVIIFLLALASFAFDSEKKASAEQQAIAVMRR